MIAEDDDEASKTEEPSERKISKAKEEGDIAISQDAKSFIMLLGMLFVIWLVLPLMFKWFYMFSLKFVENPDAIPTDGRHIRLLLYNTVIAPHENSRHSLCHFHGARHFCQRCPDRFRLRAEKTGTELEQAEHLCGNDPVYKHEKKSSRA